MYDPLILMYSYHSILNYMVSSVKRISYVVWCFRDMRYSGIIL